MQRSLSPRKEYKIRINELVAQKVTARLFLSSGIETLLLSYHLRMSALLSNLLKHHPVKVFFFCWLLIISGYGHCVAASAPKRDSTETGWEVSLDTLIARVYSYTERNGLNLKDFGSEIYARHYLRTYRRNGLTRYVPGLFRLERGENDYFGESLARYRFRPPAEVDKKTLAAFTTMPYLPAGNDQWTGRYSLSIYSANLFTDRILSPLNRRNRRFYRYRVQSCYEIEGKRIVSLRVKPRVYNTQLVRGKIDIEMATGRVHHFSFDFTYDGSRLHVSGEMGREGQASLLPYKILLVSRMKFLGNRFEEAYEATATYDFSETHTDKKQAKRRDRFDLTEQCRLRTDTTRMRRDRDFFDSHRPFPLMAHQQAVYDRYAESKTKTFRPLLPDTTAKKRLRMSPATEKFLFDNHSYSIGKKAQIKLPALLTPSMIQWSKNKGFSLQARFRFRYDFLSQRAVNFSPRVGYNFKQRQVYWQLPLNLTFWPSHNGYVDISAAGGDHMYNSRQADEVRSKLHGVTGYDSLVNIFNSYEFHYYRDNHLKAMVSVQPVVGLQIGAGVRYHHRSLLHWNDIAAQSGMYRHLSSIAPRLHVMWTPGQYYYRDGLRPVPLHSQWPTFMLDYERGLQAAGAHTDYERIEFDAKYYLPLYALRALYFRAGGGFYTRRSNNCFLDYDYFRNSYMPEGWEDEMSGQFQLLDSRWYNESRHYARLSAAYESPMLLFSRLKFLTKIVQKERVYLNLLHVNKLGYYGEWGYGLSTPILDAAVFVAVAGHKQAGIGGKVAFRLFDD